MTTELVLATNMVKACLAAAAAMLTLLLMRDLQSDRRTLFWLFLAASELLLTVMASAMYYGWGRLTLLGYTGAEPPDWPHSPIAAVLNVVFAHGCWLFILVSYRIYHARRNAGAASTHDMLYQSGRALVLIVISVMVVAILLSAV